MFSPSLLQLLALTSLSLISSAASTTSPVRASSSISTSNPSATVSGNLHASVGSGTNATCISKTINYITHTLPQQCLRTDRTSSYRPNLIDNNATTSIVNTSTSVKDGIHPDEPELHAEDTTAIHTGNSSHPPAGSEALSEPTSSPVALTSSTTTALSTAPTESPQPEAETDSPLDNANFLSFEEWKKQNLVNAGQNPDSFGQPHNKARDRNRPAINDLEVLGEESEIEIDFSGFRAGSFSSAGSHAQGAGTPSDAAAETPAATPLLRSKDAGKTCKERTNYASFDCAATVLKSNPECRSASSILVENRDSYMLNTCSAENKFFIVELCNYIWIDTVVLANYEFFSSIFRHFRVSISDRYPVKMDKWKSLGTFEASNTRAVQAFLIEQPQIWARYLRIEFLSHYGSEYYCPLSLLRVHGTTMMEQFRQEEESARGEISDPEEEVESETTTAAAPVEEPVEHPREPEESKNLSSPITESLPATTDVDTSDETNIREASTDDDFVAKSTETCKPNDAGSFFAELTLSDSYDLQCLPMSPPAEVRTSEPPKAQPVDENSTTQVQTTTPTQLLPGEVSKSSPATSTTNSANSSSTTSVSVESLQHNSSMTSILQMEQSKTTAHSPVSKSQHTSATGSNGSGDAIKAASASSVSAHPPQPSTQESFFTSIHKRLKQLESNSTLSLQYIEEQSRILRDAFGKVEKRQLGTTTAFLSHLNDTVMTELQGFRSAYDQLWQSTVIELEGQREQYQREMIALSSRLTLVADELLWEKRMGIAQSTLLLLCLALVLFARPGGGQLEMPLMQQVLQRSHAAALRYSGYDSEPASPTPSRSPVSLFRRRIFRRSGALASPSDDNQLSDGDSSRPQSKDDVHPELHFQPPTPASEEEYSDAEEGEDSEPREIQSGPATPSGRRETLQRAPSWPSIDGAQPRPISPVRSFE